MSDYVSMRSINLRNQIMTPAVLNAYRSGDISYKTMQNVSSPLQEIYANTYQYLQYPNLSADAQAIVALVAPQSIGKYVGNDDVAYRVAQSILPKAK